MSSMVRSFILPPSQRQAIEDYLRDLPSAMGNDIRQLRLKTRHLNLDAMEYDIALLRRLIALDPPIGRKSADVLAAFRIKQTQSRDVSAGFRTPETREGL